MAPKKKPEAIVPAGQTETGIVNGNWLEEMKQEAKDLAAKFQVSSSRISFKSDGKIYVGDNEVDNPLSVLIVDACHDNALYEGKFDPNNYVPPVCFALGRDEATMKPHPDSPKPQHTDCKSCKLNQFGSSGNGKACKNSVRLVCLPGNTDASNVATLEAAQVSIPPTSLNAWGSYVKGLRDAGMVPWATITQIQNSQFKTYFKLAFRPVNRITREVWDGLKARKASFEEILMQPYKAKEEAAAPAKQAKGRGKF